METIVNATDTTVTELATAPAGTMAVGSPPGTRMRAGPVRIRHLGGSPWVHPDAYVAPTAVLSGQVSVGAGSCIMHRAVLAAGRIAAAPARCPAPISRSIPLLHRRLP